MNSPKRPPTIVHLLAEARRTREATPEKPPKRRNAIASSELTVDKGKIHHYQGKPFTGVAVSHWPEGGLHQEQAFSKGEKDGMHRVYDSSARLLEETPYRANAVDGISWTWHDNGQMACELFAMLGVPLFRRKWDDRGDLREEYKLDENNWRYARVLKKLEDLMN